MGGLDNPADDFRYDGGGKGLPITFGRRVPPCEIPKDFQTSCTISWFILLTLQQRAQKGNPAVDRLPMPPRTFAVLSP